MNSIQVRAVFVNGVCLLLHEKMFLCRPLQMALQCCRLSSYFSVLFLCMRVSVCLFVCNTDKGETWLCVTLSDEKSYIGCFDVHSLVFNWPPKLIGHSVLWTWLWQQALTSVWWGGINQCIVPSCGETFSGELVLHGAPADITDCAAIYWLKQT